MEIASVAEEIELDESTLLEKKSLEENKLGWATGVAEFENEIFSQGEVSHKEITLFSEKEFVTFLSLDVTIDTDIKDKMIDFTLYFDFWEGWNCSLDCFEGTLVTWLIETAWTML